MFMILISEPGTLVLICSDAVLGAEGWVDALEELAAAAIAVTPGLITDLNVFTAPSDVTLTFVGST